jgi:hypothetical protein
MFMQTGTYFIPQLDEILKAHPNRRPTCKIKKEIQSMCNMKMDLKKLYCEGRMCTEQDKNGRVYFCFDRLGGHAVA